MTKMEKAALALIGLLCEKVIALEEECEKLRARPTQEDYTRLVKENGELRSKLDARLVVTPSSAQDDFDPSAPRASGRRKQRRANV